jgi:predicted MFS family arabinose efflux permease
MTNRWLILAIVFVARTSMGFQFQSIASVAPLLMRDLEMSYAQLGWLIGIFMLPGAVFALPGGLLGQRFGDRRVVAGSLALMAAGGAITGQSDSFALAIAGRLLSGIGAVLMNILLAKVVADWFAGQEISTAMAVMLTAWPVGLGLASATLGHAGEAWSWRAAIHVTDLLAVLGLALMVLLYREAPDLGPRPGVTFNLSRRDVLFSVSTGLAWTCFNASLVTVLSFGPALLVSRGVPIGRAGWIVSFAVWLTMLSIPLGGVLADRLRRPDLVIVGGSLVAALATVALPIVPHPGLGFSLIGIAVGAPPGAVMSLLPGVLRPENLAAGLGVYYTVFYLGMALAQPAAGFVRDRSGSPDAPVLFAATVMTGTALGLALFRRLERRSATAASA